jgi:pyruvate oxidase
MVNHSTTVADVIISTLEHWGVRFVFGIPGGSSLALVEALRKNTRMQYIVVRHEATAAMAASAYNKLTGKMAACLTIAGPGATNLATGLYDAKEDRASVISLNGQVRGQYTVEGNFQEIDQDAFFRPITVYNNTITDERQTGTILMQALRSALVHHGVAQISVPNDIQTKECDMVLCSPETCLAVPLILPADIQIQNAVAAIDASSRPVIIAGWGAYAYGNDVKRFAEKIGASILTTFRAKGILPESDPWVLGVLGDVGSQYARKTAEEADLLITLGVGYAKLTNVPSDVPLVQVDLDPMKLGKYPFVTGLWGDCGLILNRLLASVKNKSSEEVRRTLADMKAKWAAELDREADPTASPLRPPFIMKILSESLPEDAVISLDVGENAWWFGRNFRMARQRFTMSGYLGTMGYGLPGAIAAKLAYPQQTVVCITGDGGFAMAMADLFTAVKYKLPMVVVIMNNHELAMIAVEQKMEHYPVFAIDLLNPDFAKYAQDCGALGVSVSRPQDLRPAIAKALASNVPAVVDVETDPRRFVVSSRKQPVAKMKTVD